VAIVAAIALVGAGLLLRDNGSGGSAQTTPAINFTGIPQTGITLGDPSAKVTLREYVDAQCPGCRYYALEMLPAMVKEYVKPGKLKIEYHGYPFVGRDSVKALRFVLAAGKQDRLWQLQEALYQHQAAENSGWVTDDLIRNLASEIPGLNVNKLFADANSKPIAQQAVDAYNKGNALGLPGTPSFFIKIGDQKPYYIQVALDVNQMRAALDDALKG